MVRNKFIISIPTTLNCNKVLGCPKILREKKKNGLKSLESRQESPTTRVRAGKEINLQDIPYSKFMTTGRGLVMRLQMIRWEFRIQQVEDEAQEVHEVANKETESKSWGPHGSTVTRDQVMQD
jgi:hypothetical protein